MTDTAVALVALNEEVCVRGGVPRFVDLPRSKRRVCSGLQPATRANNGEIFTLPKRPSEEAASSFSSLFVKN